MFETQHWPGCALGRLHCDTAGKRQPFSSAMSVWRNLFPDDARRNFRSAFFKNTRAFIVGNEFCGRAAHTRRHDLRCGAIAASELFNNMLRVVGIS